MRRSGSAKSAPDRRPGLRRNRKTMLPRRAGLCRRADARRQNKFRAQRAAPTREATMLRMAVMAVVALAVVRPGSAAEVTYYQLPTGAYPHDVAPGPNGTIWYTGQRKGFLGRFDPKTGKNEEIALGQGSAPHGVVVAADGGAWVTDGGQNAMVRVDPATKAVKVFPLPKDTPYANLNTPTIGKDGIVWFTGQNGYHGRVDPKSGKVDVWKSPRNTGPYGMTTTPAGDVWYASLAGDYIGKVDLSTGNVTVVDPPKARS